VEVVVDDRLPVNIFGQLKGLRSNEPNEFWSALLEKAYAKLFRGYEALEGGLTCDAFEDFSGGISEIFDLNKPPKNLFTIIQKAIKRGSMMGCSLKPDANIKEAVGSNGLVQGHAYTVTGAKTAVIALSGEVISVELIRLRNPWGKGEWNGSWSDGSIEWQLLTNDERKRVGITVEQDGEFWMSYDDFTSYFERLDLCTTSAQPLDEEKRKDHFWDTIAYDGAWIKETSAGGCRNYIATYHTNPQCVVTLRTDDVTYNQGLCNILISLMQKYGRDTKSGPGDVPIGFAVFPLEDRHISQVPMKNVFFRYTQPVERTTYINSRGITARYKLKPGHYLIVPSTFYPNTETEFLLRVCFESDDFGDKKLIFFKEANQHVKDSGNFVEVRTIFNNN